jgi:propanol-preferring alcohol dehydrogenase
MESTRPASLAGIHTRAVLAYRLTDWQTAELTDVPVPRPGPGQVLIKVGAAGLCGTDVKLMDAEAARSPFAPPYTLGHEIAGWVDRLGDGVDDLVPGEAVAVSAGSFCGSCELCLTGQTNYCPGAASGRGFGSDGGLAEFVAVPRRHLFGIGTLSPAQAAPLTDAAVTAYHAVRHARPHIRPGSTAVVIGAGGLGGYGIQFLQLLTGASVIAIDVTPGRLEFAAELGAAHTFLAAEDNATTIRALTDGSGADAVLDFVGTESAVSTAMAAVRSPGAVLLVGGAGGAVPFGHTTLPRGVTIQSPTGSTAGDLQDVLRLARAGQLRIEAEQFRLSDADRAYAALREGRLRSRAVVIP